MYVNVCVKTRTALAPSRAERWSGACQYTFMFYVIISYVLLVCTLETHCANWIKEEGRGVLVVTKLSALCSTPLYLTECQKYLQWMTNISRLQHSTLQTGFCKHTNIKITLLNQCSSFKLFVTKSISFVDKEEDGLNLKVFTDVLLEKL